jgi:hypothetical protein
VEEAMNLSKESVRSERSLTPKCNTPFLSCYYKTRQPCLKTQAPSPWTVQIKFYYVKLQNVQMGWTGGEASKLMRAAVYFGIFSNNSLTFWHTLNVTSVDYQAAV